jgi:hypothetical protein
VTHYKNAHGSWEITSEFHRAESYDGNSAGFSLVLRAVWVLVGLLAAAALAWHLVEHVRESRVAFATPYQAVLLANGSVYFGQLEGFGGRHPVLTSVFYIVSQTNTDTKQVNNVLVKRGKELHEPDRMYLNPNEIIFDEPVGANSKVAQLIAEARQ